MPPEVEREGRSSSGGGRAESSSLSNTAGDLTGSPTSDSPGNRSRGPAVWASSSFGWDDTLDMDEQKVSVVGGGGERFSGRADGLSVADLRVGHENKLQLLRSRRSATAATLTDEDKFAVLLELCTEDAYHVIHDHFRARLKTNAEGREETEAKNLAMERKVADDYHEAMEKPDAVPMPVPSWPRLVPKGDPTLMTDAWKFLETTWPEQSARSLSDYHNFAFVKGRSTHATFHFLRELCRKNGKPVEGREITERALKALRREVRVALEQGVLQWTAAECTLARLEKDARQVEDALHTRDLERAAQTVVKTVTQKVEQLTVSKSNPRPVDEPRQRQERNPGSQGGKKGKGKGKDKQAYAVTAPPAKGQGGDFPGNCNNCGEWGHKRADCKSKPKGGAGNGPRKPGANCKHCGRKDSHDSNECWQKFPEKRPESWKQRGGGGDARPAYAAVGLDEEGDPGEEEYDPSYAWSAQVSDKDMALLLPVEPAMAVSDDLPEVRDSTKAQRDTEPAARARGERERLAARAKEERLRQGGPPPAFFPKGGRSAPEANGTTNGGDQDSPGEEETGEGPESTVPAQTLPPSFGEYPVSDPRYQGLEEFEQAGVRPDLLAEPVVGPQSEAPVRRPRPFEVVAAAAFCSPEYQEDFGPFVLSVGAPLRCRGGAGDSDDDEPGEDEAAALLSMTAPGRVAPIPPTSAAATGAAVGPTTTGPEEALVVSGGEEAAGAGSGPSTTGADTTAGAGEGAAGVAPTLPTTGKEADRATTPEAGGTQGPLTVPTTAEGATKEPTPEAEAAQDTATGPGAAAEAVKEQTPGAEASQVAPEESGADEGEGAEVQEGQETQGATSGEEEEEALSETAEDQEMTPELRDITSIPRRYRYFPPAQLPEKGERGITKHLDVMIKGFSDGAPINREEHKGQGWLPRKSWSNMHQGDFEGYILWWGRWLVAYQRYRHIREAAGEALPPQDQYVLDALHQVGDSLLDFFRNNRRLGNTTKPDLTYMVRIHEYLLERPVRREEQDIGVRLGPPPEVELSEESNRGSRGFTRVPLSLLQAYFAARYGPNWLEGFLRSTPVQLPAGEGPLYCQRQYPNIKSSPIDFSSVPIATPKKRMRQNVPYIPILAPKHWVTRDRQVGWPKLTPREQAEEDRFMAEQRRARAAEREKELRGGKLQSAAEEAADAAEAEAKRARDLQASQTRLHEEQALPGPPTTATATQREESTPELDDTLAQAQRAEAAYWKLHQQGEVGRAVTTPPAVTPPGPAGPRATIEELWRQMRQSEAGGATTTPPATTPTGPEGPRATLAEGEQIGEESEDEETIADMARQLAAKRAKRREQHEAEGRTTILPRPVVQPPSTGAETPTTGGRDRSRSPTPAPPSHTETPPPEPSTTPPPLAISGAGTAGGTTGGISSPLPPLGPSPPTTAGPPQATGDVSPLTGHRRSREEVTSSFRSVRQAIPATGIQTQPVYAPTRPTVLPPRVPTSPAPTAAVAAGRGGGQPWRRPRGYDSDSSHETAPWIVDLAKTAEEENARQACDAANYRPNTLNAERLALEIARRLPDMEPNERAEILEEGPARHRWAGEIVFYHRVGPQGGPPPLRRIPRFWQHFPVRENTAFRRVLDTYGAPPFPAADEQHEPTQALEEAARLAVERAGPWPERFPGTGWPEETRVYAVVQAAMALHRIQLAAAQDREVPAPALLQIGRDLADYLVFPPVLPIARVQQPRSPTFARQPSEAEGLEEPAEETWLQTVRKAEAQARAYETARRAVPSGTTSRAQAVATMLEARRRSGLVGPGAAGGTEEQRSRAAPPAPLEEEGGTGFHTEALQIGVDLLAGALTPGLSGLFPPGSGASLGDIPSQGIPSLSGLDLPPLEDIPPLSQALFPGGIPACLAEIIPSGPQVTGVNPWDRGLPPGAHGARRHWLDEVVVMVGGREFAWDQVLRQTVARASRAIMLRLHPPGAHSPHLQTFLQREIYAAMRGRAPLVPSPVGSPEPEARGTPEAEPAAEKEEEDLEETSPPAEHPPQQGPRRDGPDDGGGAGGSLPAGGATQGPQGSQAGGGTTPPAEQAGGSGSQGRSRARSHSIEQASHSPPFDLLAALEPIMPELAHQGPDDDELSFPALPWDYTGEKLTLPPELPAMMVYSDALYSSPLELLDPAVRSYLAEQLARAPARRGNRQLERVRAPIVRTSDRALWVNGKPLKGSAILDTGAMPLLIGRPGMAQLGLTAADVEPRAVRLALADGKATQMFGVTRAPLLFTFNPGSTTETSLSVKAVVTEAPYDFLLGNVILWVVGGIIDGWREQFRYQVNWRAGQARTDGPEGFIPLTYERETIPRQPSTAHYICGPTILNHTQGGDIEGTSLSLVAVEEVEISEAVEVEPRSHMDLVIFGEDVDQDPDRLDTTGPLEPDDTEVPAPDPDLRGLVIRGNSRSDPPAEGEPEWDWEANPDGGWYLDEVPGWLRGLNPERLQRLTRFVSTGGPEANPDFWEDEEERLQLRRTRLQEAIRNYSAGDSALGHYRRELAQIELLFDLQGEMQRDPRPSVRHTQANRHHRAVGSLPRQPLDEQRWEAIEGRRTELSRRLDGVFYTRSYQRRAERDALEHAWEVQYRQLGLILRALRAERREVPTPESMPELLSDTSDDEGGDSGREELENQWERAHPCYALEVVAEPDDQEVWRQLEQYRGEAKIWSGDNIPTHLFGPDHWLTVLLLFGGIGAELEALLKAGVKCKRILYVENDSNCRDTFGYRLRELHHHYPNQLPLVAFHNTRTSLPWDITEIGERELIRCIGSDANDPIHLVTISSPCQGFSRANRQAQGLSDRRSGLIFEGYRVLSLIQKLQRPHGQEPGYIFEMVDASDHPSPPARWGFQQMELISGGYAGSGIRTDAAKLGSAAHRTRVYWTNLARATDIQERYRQTDRQQITNRLDAQDSLDPSRTVQVATRDDPAYPGIYHLNVAGEPIRAFPTIVATPGSYAFRETHYADDTIRGPGMVHDREKNRYEEPNADERERIMGMFVGSTDRPGATEEQRRQQIGNAVDVRAYTWLSMELYRWRALNLDE